MKVALLALNGGWLLVWLWLAVTDHRRGRIANARAALCVSLIYALATAMLVVDLANGGIK